MCGTKACVRRRVLPRARRLSRFRLRRLSLSLSFPRSFPPIFAAFRDDSTAIKTAQNNDRDQGLTPVLEMRVRVRVHVRMCVCVCVCVRVRVRVCARWLQAGEELGGQMYGSVRPRRAGRTLALTHTHTHTPQRTCSPARARAHARARALRALARAQPFPRPPPPSDSCSPLRRPTQAFDEPFPPSFVPGTHAQARECTRTHTLHLHEPAHRHVRRGIRAGANTN